eukprot:scaffold35107_cov70-Phaeocystis_antarctica.AAC.3
MVRAHRHDTVRLGVRGVTFLISVLVAHLLDQSGVFGVWSTVALGGRGHAFRLHLLACERRSEARSENT